MKNTKTLFTIILIGALIMELGNCNLKAAALTSDIDWDAQGFTKMKTTAYCMGHHTAMGVPVHNGICAVSNEHLGDVAIIYTTDGNFLGYYYCCDTGGTDAIRNGYVIDVYRSNYTQAKNYMRITRGAVYVKFVSGKG